MKYFLKTDQIKNFKMMSTKQFFNVTFSYSLHTCQSSSDFGDYVHGWFSLSFFSTRMAASAMHLHLVLLVHFLKHTIMLVSDYRPHQTDRPHQTNRRDLLPSIVPYTTRCSMESCLLEILFETLKNSLLYGRRK